jgi:rhodanese-related sulfurtransferase
MRKDNILVLLLIACSVVFIFLNNGIAEEGGGKEVLSTFEKVAKETTIKDGVREITYEQFMKIRNSGEAYILLDVLSEESYNAGHIEGAVSLPVYSIDKATAAGLLSKDSKVVVYCGSFMCGASSNATKKLSSLGYDVLDYKGGLKEWQDKGNALVR